MGNSDAAADFAAASRKLDAALAKFGPTNAASSSSSSSSEECVVGLLVIACKSDKGFNSSLKHGVGHCIRDAEVSVGTTKYSTRHNE